MANYNSSPLARTLYALLPAPTMTGAIGDAEQQYVVADRLIECLVN